MINKDEAKNHPKRNVLMKAIGVSDEIDAKIQIFPLTQGYLLLCSDGLYNSVEDLQLFQIMSTNALLKDKLEALVKLALNQGASDNISIAAIQIDGGDLDE
ncbi:MAG: serine/threonine-protein phosphatase, partial [Beduini sp.]